MSAPVGIPLLPAVQRFLGEPKRHFIGGDWNDEGVDTFEVSNPADGSELTTIPVAGQREVDLAVQAAREAFTGDWGMIGGQRRAELVWRLADKLQEHGEEMAQLESLDNGKPVWQSREDVAGSVAHLRYFAGWADKLEGSSVPVEGGQLVYTLREPLGVAGLIVPWNFPLAIAVWKLAPALACGNAVVLKPSELTPMTSLRLAELAHEVGFPPGSINVVLGPGQPTGEVISAHMEIDKVSFTGSTAAGRRVMAASASSNLKRVSLELGGKSPHLIFADADLAKAVETAVWAGFFNSGQECTAGSRLYVESRVAGEVQERLAERIGTLRIGHPFEEVDLGPLISETHLERVLASIAAAREEGARVVVDGRRQEGTGGYYLSPTLFAHDHDELSLVRDEIFGPVLTVGVFEGEDEVVSRANASRYGLAAAIWTADVSRAHRMAGKLQAGTVWVNGYDRFDPAAPFGGYKESGHGREMGKEALDLYTQTKTVWVEV